MTDPSELLILRLALIGIVFVFILATALVLRGTLAPRAIAGRRPAGSASLVVLGPARTGLSAGVAFPLAGETTLGRDPTNGIVLADPSVSGRHAILAPVGDTWTLADLGSTNGTRVDGVHIAGDPVPLTTGATLLVGAVRFRFDVANGRPPPARSR